MGGYRFRDRVARRDAPRQQGTIAAIVGEAVGGAGVLYLVDWDGRAPGAEVLERDLVPASSEPVSD